jgi:hypothetical protein
VDLKKAFDSVSRDGLWLILAKYGVPASLIAIIKRMHTGIEVRFKYGGSACKFPSLWGVKQGDNLAPVLFLFVMQAVMETVMQDWNMVEPLAYRTREDGVTHSRMPRATWTETGGAGWIGEMSDQDWVQHYGVTTFNFWAALYADDGGFAFGSRGALEQGGQRLFHHLKRFGLNMHIGTTDKSSKTEAVFFPGGKLLPQRQGPDYTPMLKPANVTDMVDTTKILGTLPYSRSFVYLGSMAVPSLCSIDDVERRMSMANKISGALKTCVFKNKSINSKLKGRIYTALVLSVLLYGCENWIISRPLITKLEVFQNRNIRTMFGITRWTQSLQRITSVSLLKRAGLVDMETLLTGRQAGWMGHVARMSEKSIPRKFMSSFLTLKRINHPRASFGSAFQDFVIGRALQHPEMIQFPLNKDLMEIHLDLEGTFGTGARDSFNGADDRPRFSWIHLAKDKMKWAHVRALMNHSMLGGARLEEAKRFGISEAKKTAKFLRRLELEKHYWPDDDEIEPDGGGDPEV